MHCCIYLSLYVYLIFPYVKCTPIFSFLIYILFSCFYFCLRYIVSQTKSIINKIKSIIYKIKNTWSTPSFIFKKHLVNTKLPTFNFKPISTVNHFHHPFHYQPFSIHFICNTNIILGPTSSHFFQINSKWLINNFHCFKIEIKRLLGWKVQS